MKQKINLFWFRRDLRLHDNHGFYKALQSGIPVLPVFVFDTEILEKLNDRKDARVNFIYSRIKQINSDLIKVGSSIKIFHCKPLGAFQQLTAKYDVRAVYTNTDYEPYGIKRDNEINDFLQKRSIEFYRLKDHVIFEPAEVTKDNREPYTVFTPYSKKWKALLGDQEIQSFASENLLDGLIKTAPFLFPELNEIGFEKNEMAFPEMDISEQLISGYTQNRNFPAIPGTSKIGIHLRFGTISIREITRLAKRISEDFLNELIWRNFFIDILWHFPQVEKNAFKPIYNFITWRNNEIEFDKWCRGETGFPMVDAGMRELKITGFMHNRVRMVTASFLVKHLLVDWRWGEAYFAEKLLDFELASNNGNWQWAAGCGCDAAPYFRVFNPETQLEKFDKQEKYIRKWIPEYGTEKYPKPIVDHKFARERVLKVFKEALK